MILIQDNFSGLAGGLDGQSPTINTTGTHWSALVDDNLEIDGDGNGIGPHDGGTKPTDTLDAGTAEYQVSVQFSGQGGTNGVAGAIVFRAIDADNCYRFVLDSSGAAGLKKVTAGVATSLASYSVPFTHGTRYRLSVLLLETSAVLSLAGVKLGTISGLTQGSTSTLVGLWSDNRLGAEVPTFNNFEVDSLELLVKGTFDTCSPLDGTFDTAPPFTATLDTN